MTHEQRFTKSDQKLGRTILDDFKRGGLKHTVKTDLKDLYNFYLDEEARARLQNMSSFRRWLSRVWWLIKSLFLNLTPARRILVLIGLWLAIQSPIRWSWPGLEAELDPDTIGFIILLVVLMLELKDKLLARDELAVGRAVQLALLPDDVPQVPGWDMWFYTRPANDVGGDLVDYLWTSPQRLGLVLGDVSGKGLGAALLMSKLQATIRAIATDTTGLAELGERINKIFCRDQVPGRFATLLYLELDVHTGELRLLNAGHLPPWVLAPDGHRELTPVALPVGVVPEALFQEQTIELTPGSLLVAYSDGVTEAQDEHGEFFGDDRLERLLEGMRGQSAESAGRRILHEVGTFMKEAPPTDDLSLVLLRRLPREEQS